MMEASLADSLKAFLQAILEALPGAAGRSGVLQIATVTCSDAPQYPVRLTGPTAHLLRTDHPLPNLVKFTFAGRVTPVAGVTDPVVRVSASPVENPQLTGRVETILPLPADGQLSRTITLTFRTGEPTPRVLHFEVSVIAPGGTLATQTVPVELIDLAGFIALLLPYEPAVPSGLDFLAAVRKVLLPSTLFNLAVGRAAGVPPKFAKGTAAAGRLSAYKELLAAGRLVDISHVIVGVEGAHRFKPRPTVPIPRVDLVVSWAGDIGSVVQEWVWGTYYLKDPQTKTLEGYLVLLSGVSELIGDIDGVNLAAEYLPELSLAENLRRYYEHAEEDRFKLFIANTYQDDGSPALPLGTGLPPRLTAEARRFVAVQTSNFVMLALLQALLSSPEFPDKTYAPDGALAAAQPNSPEIQFVTNAFVDFLEKGLAAEGA